MTAFTLESQFNVSAETLYAAWLDSDRHSVMTGGEAHCSDQEGGDFTAWDGYIQGKNISLIPNERIEQQWRTVEFPEEAEDSKLVITFHPKGDACKLIISHSHIPLNQPDYEQGWEDNYFEPMNAYFNDAQE